MSIAGQVDVSRAGSGGPDRVAQEPKRWKCFLVGQDEHFFPFVKAVMAAWNGESLGYS